jgi:hypothetical protein
MRSKFTLLFISLLITCILAQIIVWSNDAHYTPKGYQLMASLNSDSIVGNEIIR